VQTVADCDIIRSYNNKLEMRDLPIFRLCLRVEQKSTYPLLVKEGSWQLNFFYLFLRGIYVWYPTLSNQERWIWLQLFGVPLHAWTITTKCWLVGTPRIMLRDMSDLDGIFPSYITGEMSMGPILNWTRVTCYALCSI